MTSADAICLLKPSLFNSKYTNGEIKHICREGKAANRLSQNKIANKFVESIVKGNVKSNIRYVSLLIYSLVCLFMYLSIYLFISLYKTVTEMLVGKLLKIKLLRPGDQCRCGLN